MSLSTVVCTFYFYQVCTVVASENRKTKISVRFANIINIIH